MLYRWDNGFQLDRAGGLLTQQGQHVEVSRKVLKCIGCLIEHRERVLGYEELIHEIWGHPNASHHQLAQVLLAARRAVGDDGQAQRLIRTIAGMGYRWVGPLTEHSSAEADGTTSAAAPDQPSRRPLASDLPQADPTPVVAVPIAAAPAEASPRTTAPAAPETPSPPALAEAGADAPPPRRKGLPSPRLLASLAVAAAALSAMLALRSAPEATANTNAASGPPDNAAAMEGDAGDPIQRLEYAMFLGRFEEVREGLENLPPELADSPQAHLVGIDLDLNRGRFSRAGEKIQTHLLRAQAAGDVVWQASLLSRRSELNNRLQLSGAEVLAPAEAAVALLEAQPDAPQDVLADALWRRSYGHTLSDRFDLAQQDLVRARDMYLRMGDARRSTNMRASLARVWMRDGRLSEALEEMGEAADAFAGFKDNVREIFARNTMTKIQIELLRWDDALISNDRSMALLREAPDSERRYPTLQLRAMALTGQGRLREAASLLDEAAALNYERTDFVIPALHALEAGKADAALAAARREFDNTRIDTRSNLLLENKDGAVLLWTMAAQALVDAGGPIPQPSAEQTTRLNQPATALARLARGRWHWLQGRHRDAETDMRAAFEQFRADHQLYRARLAAEPLLRAMLGRGDIAGARNLLVELRAQDPERIESDYRSALMRLALARAENQPQEIRLAYSEASALAGERRLHRDAPSAAPARSGVVSAVSH